MLWTMIVVWRSSRSRDRRSFLNGAVRGSLRGLTAVRLITVRPRLTSVVAKYRIHRIR